jgi:hypothetical protein
MVAQHRAEVDDLNQRARRRLVNDGLVVGPALAHETFVLQEGDRIVCLRNNRRLDLRNGMTGTITNVDADRKEFAFVDRDDVQRRVPWRYLEAGHVAHGYATTIHKSQGRTVERCYVLGNDHLDREVGYVALSRGRDANHLYLPPAIPEPEQHAPDLDTEREPETVAAAALAHSHVEQLAVDQHPDRTARRLELDQLQRDIERYKRLIERTPPDRARDLAALDLEVGNLQGERHRAAAALTTAQHTSPFRRSERRIAIAAAQRTLDHVDQRLDVATSAMRTVEAAQRERDDYITNHGDPHAKLTAATPALLTRIRQLVDSYTDDLPAYLAHLGPRPPAGSRDELGWLPRAQLVELRRIQQHITDDTTYVDRDRTAIDTRSVSVVNELNVERGRHAELDPGLEL